MKTVKELAQLEGITPRSFQRRIEKHYQELKEVNGEDFRFYKGDTLPQNVIIKLIDQGALKPLTASPKPQNVNGTEKKPKKHAQQRPPAASKREKVFMGGSSKNALPLLAAFIIVLADGISSSYIALNAFSELKVAAAIFWGLAGAVIGYVAIRNIIRYKGYEGDAWAGGFALWQISLHLCAMSVLGAESFYIGKIVLCVGLGIATPGLAVTMKNDKS